MAIRIVLEGNARAMPALVPTTIGPMTVAIARSRF
jgi:hypothetical protein